ncbi:hypothetical protein RB601_002100 [Gaeumannomyces tritici]
MVALKALLTAALGASSLVAADGLNARAKAKGRYWGTCVNPGVLNDGRASAVVKNGEDFGSYTAENEMKFDALEPSRGNFNYGNADRIVTAAKAIGAHMRCHALVWHAQVPGWVRNGGFNKATLISIMETHIKNVVGHFKGSCYAWDVVNEALNEDGSYRTGDSIWGRTIGATEFIPLAFKAARAADPAAKLYYNDYNCDKPGRKATGAQNLIKMVKAAGAPIDGMGLQGHMSVGQVGPVSTLVQNLNAFTALGVDVAYTELDIAARSGSSQFAQQATDYGYVVQACMQVSRCVGITAWGFTDAHSWISGGNALIWDSSYNKKPAYNAILNGFGR